jgi:hypothetical protein
MPQAAAIGTNRHPFAAAFPPDLVKAWRTRADIRAWQLYPLASNMVETPMREAFHIGQLVRISRPSSGYADHRTYCIVCLVSKSDGYAVYRVKNTVGGERLVRADEIEAAALTAVP